MCVTPFRRKNGTIKLKKISVFSSGAIISNFSQIRTISFVLKGLFPFTLSQSVLFYIPSTAARRVLLYPAATIRPDSLLGLIIEQRLPSSLFWDDSILALFLARVNPVLGQNTKLFCAYVVKLGRMCFNGS